MANSKLDLHKKLKLFDEKYRSYKVSNVPGYTTYAFPAEGRETIQLVSEFLLEAALIGDKLWGALKIDSSNNGVKQNLIVLERKLI